MKSVVQNLCGLPLVGGFVALIIGFILPIIPFFLLLENVAISKELITIFAGLTMAAWAYFLKHTGTVNIVTPFIPIPLWIFGLLIAAVALFSLVTGYQFS